MTRLSTRRFSSFPLSLSVAWLAVAGCKDEYKDDAFGVLDLAPLFDDDRENAFIPDVPQILPVQSGYNGGELAEYYDFGGVPTLRSPLTDEPTAARVARMYFFFNSKGQPLFSAPVRRERDRLDVMPGGRDVLNPNPIDHCKRQMSDPTCAAKNEEERRRPYAVRTRDRLVDPVRAVANYQRPVVDVSPADVTSTRPLYTGLWEIVEVTVPDDYDIDAVKQLSTLRRAISNGDFRERPTGKVINCPMVDERSLVPPGASAQLVFHPLIEVWYRRKLSFCFLANGWESLGNDMGQLYPAGAANDAQRVQTFDVATIAGGQGAASMSALVVPVSRAYVPRRETLKLENTIPITAYFDESIVTGGRPRHLPSDPPGYSPIRWMWEIGTTDLEEAFVPGAWKSVDEVEDGQSFPRFPTAARNVPLRGVLRKCGYPELDKKDKITGRNLCGVLVDNPQDPTSDKVASGKGDPACAEVGLECNTRTCYCDVPAVGYGQRCGPGITRCEDTADVLSEVGYNCLARSGGFCYLGCDLTKRNELAAQNEGRDPIDWVDSRCREKKGFICVPYIDKGICIRLCDPNIINPELQAAGCSAVVDLPNMTTIDLGTGQTCQDFGISICAWPDSYEPPR